MVFFFDKDIEARVLDEKSKRKVLAHDKAVMTAGDTVYIPGNVEHSLVCLEKGELIDIFTPEREDFI